VSLIEFESTVNVGYSSLELTFFMCTIKLSNYKVITSQLQDNKVQITM